jgi:kinesin family protein 15
VLDYLFAWMARDERKTGGQLSYRCTGSLLEIHNETLTDLLDPPDASAAAASCTLPSVGGHGGLPTGHGGLRLREDATRGIYVEGLHHEDVGTAEEATRLLQRGAAHRAVGSTAMNSHSSRSHLVFTLAVQATHEADDGIRRVRTALLHLVDLAGSERQRDTQATGARLREACHINRSLSALGNVITALTSGGGQSRALKTNPGALSALPSAVPSTGGSGATHVPYRNSKLTLLLKDSLGGNSKTCIIATISPLERCFAETLSTLKFAQRAKLIRNQVSVITDGS